MKVLRENGREVALTALLRTSQQVCFYIFTTYVLTYATTVLGFGRGLVLNMVMAMALVSCFANPLFGHLSDMLRPPHDYRDRLRHHARLPVHLLRPARHEIAAAGLPAILLSNPLQDLQYGPQAAFISESFPASLRYSGSALGYQLASITAGGPAPLDRDAAAAGVRDLDGDRVVHLDLLGDQPGLRASC